MLEKDKKKIVKSELIAMMENGMTRPEIAEHYGIPATQLKRAIAQLGLTGTRAKSSMFIVEDDTVAANQTAIPFDARNLAQTPEPTRVTREEIAARIDLAVDRLIAMDTVPTPTVETVAEAPDSGMAEDSLF